MKKNETSFIKAIDENQKADLLAKDVASKRKTSSKTKPQTPNPKPEKKQVSKSAIKTEEEVIQPYVVPEPVVGIALGGGGALGIAHIGVLRVLHRAGIIPTKWAGTSIGAIVGGLYCNGVSITKMNKLARQLRGYHLLDFGFMSKGFLKGRSVERILKKYINPKTTFQNLKHEFCCIATDLYTGKEVVLKEGNLLKSIRASFSVPGVFAPTTIDDMFLVDGGLLNNVPDDVVKHMGSDIVIAVDLVNDYLEHPEINTVADVIYRSAILAEYKLRQLKKTKADVVIAPKVEHYKQFVFNEKIAKELIKLGEEATKQALPDIQDKIAKWKENYVPKLESKKETKEAK